MAFLIVDPDEKSRNEAATMVTWVDRRHRVDFAENGASALSLAVIRRPRVVFIEPQLPDMAGEQLCKQLRQRLPRLTCIALTNSDIALDGFDNQLRKPPSRIEVLNAIEQAKKNTIREVERRVEPPYRVLAPVDINGPILTVYLSLSDESLKFGIPVPAQFSVGDVLKHIGKSGVRKCTLIRNGKQVSSDPHIPIKEHDHLILFK
jgi:CheY-like chemotaxis protein